MKQEIQYRDVVRAMDLAAEQQAPNVYIVESSQAGKAYNVYQAPEGGWHCTCKHHVYRHAYCKHMVSALGPAGVMP